LSFKIFKMIILYGVYNFCLEYIRTEQEKDNFSIKEDYLEALLSLFQNQGINIEKRYEILLKKKNQKTDKKFVEDLLTDMKGCMKDNDKIFIEELMDMENLKRDCSLNFDISVFFFKFLELCLKWNLSIRIKALIWNLQEMKASNYTISN